MHSLTRAPPWVGVWHSPSQRTAPHPIVRTPRSTPFVETTQCSTGTWQHSRQTETSRSRECIVLQVRSPQNIRDARESREACQPPLRSCSVYIARAAWNDQVHGSPDLHSCLRASVQAPRELLELLLQPLQAPRELLLQPFILCSASFPNQRDAFLRLVVIFQRHWYQ